MVHIKSLIKVNVLSFSHSFCIIEIISVLTHPCTIFPSLCVGRCHWCFPVTRAPLQPCLWLLLTLSHWLSSNAHWESLCWVAAQWLKLFNPLCLCPFPSDLILSSTLIPSIGFYQQPSHCAKGFLFQLLLIRALCEKEAIIFLTVHLRKQAWRG